MTAWRLLLTRPVDDSAALAEALALDGVVCSSLPLLHIEPLPVTVAMRDVVLQLDRYAAVIVISKPAARLGLALLAQCGMAPDGPLWFAVGGGTAQLLRDGGVVAHFPRQGDDSEALLSLPLLLQQLERSGARVLILRGEGGREWLGEQLHALGARVDYLQLYRRLLPEYPVGALCARMNAERLNGVVVSSGQGFFNLLQLAGEDAPQLCRLPIFVPSQRVAEIAAAAGAANVINCRGASALALREVLLKCPVPEGPAPAITDKNA